MADKLGLVNDALVRIGAEPVASLADATAQALAAETVFDNTVRNEIANHTWAFALREKDLSQLALPDEDRRWGDGEFVYQLPNDFLRAVGVRDAGHGLTHHHHGAVAHGFRLAGDQLYTDCDTASLIYVADVPPAGWPAYFNVVVIHALAAAFAVAVTDSANRATQQLNQLAEQRLRARTTDAQQMPPVVFDLMRIYTRHRHNPLVGA